MSALEQEIIEKFNRLDKDAQQRVRNFIERKAGAEQVSTSFDYDSWIREVEAIREQIRASHGGTFPSIDAVGMLREIRDGEDE